MTDAITMVGMPGSPYSRKLRSVLRYRRIEYRWVRAGSAESAGLPKPKVNLLPQLILPGPDGQPQARFDTTPLLAELERRYSGRSIVPTDPAIAFLDALLEDYADEWLTKAMFHYRWAFDADVARAAAVLPRAAKTDLAEDRSVAMGKIFSERQIGRLWVVGSNDITAPVIEQSYRRLLTLLAARLAESSFVLGQRPGACDFGMYGQLTQLVLFDPTPVAVALDVAPRVIAWVEGLEDTSGLEPKDADWIDRESVPASVTALLAEAGRVYVPFLLANAAALQSGAEKVECEIDGLPWTQQPFPYQGKCLTWLRERHAGLDADVRNAVDGLLQGTGCERLFS